MREVLIKKVPKNTAYLKDHYALVSNEEADRLIKGGYAEEKQEKVAKK